MWLSRMSGAPLTNQEGKPQLDYLVRRCPNEGHTTFGALPPVIPAAVRRRKYPLMAVHQRKPQPSASLHLFHEPRQHTLTRQPLHDLLHELVVFRNTHFIQSSGSNRLQNMCHFTFDNTKLVRRREQPHVDVEISRPRPRTGRLDVWR